VLRLLTGRATGSRLFVSRALRIPPNGYGAATCRQKKGDAAWLDLVGARTVVVGGLRCRRALDARVPRRTTELVGARLSQRPTEAAKELLQTLGGVFDGVVPALGDEAAVRPGKSQLSRLLRPIRWRTDHINDIEIAQVSDSPRFFFWESRTAK
jgi:hypothetical protein